MDNDKKETTTCRCEQNGERRLTIRSEEEKHLLNSRINKIAGQLNGVKKMIAADRYCDDILIQLSAVSSATRSLANTILENHMHSCVVADIQRGDLSSVDEIIALFKRFQ